MTDSSADGSRVVCRNRVGSTTATNEHVSAVAENKGFFDGYQAALSDIIGKAIERADNPAFGMAQWIRDNAVKDEATRERAERVMLWTEFGQ